MSITAGLSSRISSTRFVDLEPELIAAGRRLVLDGIAVAVAGADIEPAPRLLCDHFRDQGGTGSATVIGQGTSLSASQAALVNGASMHVLDYEPMWLPSTHALSPALSAALAMGQVCGSNGAEVIAAVLKGIEVQMAVLTARGHVESSALRFHPPGFVGPLGATVAAAHILGLDAETLAQALGIASSRCGGLFSNIGTMTKASHCGYAAFFGVESALLAARGFTADRDMFGAHAQGYRQAFLADRMDEEELLRFGRPWKVLEPGFAIKLFPSKFTTHYAINVALTMHARLPSAQEIERVEMVTANVPSADRPRPATGLEGKFSLQYTAAAGLLDGRVDLATFTDASLNRPAMQDLLGRVELLRDPSISSKYTGGRYLEMTVYLRDGTVLTERCDMPRGAWGTRPPSEEEHLVKVRNCLATQVPPEAVEQIVSTASALDAADGPQFLSLMELLAGSSRGGVAHAAH